MTECSGCDRTCVDHLSICQASCCKLLVFTLRGHPGCDHEHYYRVHGCRVERVNRQLYRVLVPMRCPQLTEDNLCKLHGTSMKPRLCTQLDAKTARSGKFYLTEGCMFKEKGEK